MGEYAKHAGKQIKIGTCEDMYYLRADQANLVIRESGSLDPMNAKVREVIRFRFPWPDEDALDPGAFEDYGRSVAIWGIKPPEGVEHHSVQFAARAGYLVSLPCPEGPRATHGLAVGRNGFSGPVKIVQQAYRNGNLALVCECGGCGAKYSLHTLEDAEPVIVACRAEADDLARRTTDESLPKFWHAVADRIAAGYAQPALVKS